MAVVNIKRDIPDASVRIALFDASGYGGRRQRLASTLGTLKLRIQPFIQLVLKRDEAAGRGF